MKSILISIKPRWCELIAAGKKTLEIRKSRPKLDTPFKVYIYCTLSGSNEFFRENLHGDIAAWNRGKWGERKGNVIGEFVCDGIECFTTDYRMDRAQTERISMRSCVSIGGLMEYETNAACLYAWHISDLKIYEKPKSISKFWFPPEKFCEPGLCGGCPNHEMPGEYGDVMFDCEWKRPILRPPQSWCYVEEV